MSEGMKTENYRVTKTELAGVSVSVTSYKIGESYHCHVANLDPGATIARAEADSAAEAEQAALAKAAARLKSN